VEVPKEEVDDNDESRQAVPHERAEEVGASRYMAGDCFIGHTYTAISLLLYPQSTTTAGSSMSRSSSSSGGDVAVTPTTLRVVPQDGFYQAFKVWESLRIRLNIAPRPLDASLWLRGG